MDGKIKRNEKATLLSMQTITCNLNVVQDGWKIEYNNGIPLNSEMEMQEKVFRLFHSNSIIHNTVYVCVMLQ